VKLCVRCIIPTINQQDATKGKEPLKTLASYRQKNNKIYFGQNLVHQGEGKIAIGDEILITSLNYGEKVYDKYPGLKNGSMALPKKLV